MDNINLHHTSHGQFKSIAGHKEFTYRYFCVTDYRVNAIYNAI